MRPIIALASLLCFMEIMLSCQWRDQQKSSIVAIDTAAIKASLDSVGGVVQKAHDLRDFKMLGATWAKDGILSIAGNPPVRGREAIVSTFASMPPSPPGAVGTMHILDIQVMAPTWAYVFGIDTLKYTPPGAKVPVVETSTFFVLARKTPEGWQSFREILTPNQPQKSKE